MLRHEIHLFSALDGAGVPEWVHLVPAGTFSGADGRGPYTLANVDAVIAASMAGGKLPIDENHAIDVAAPQGRPSPARGWIVALEARADGIWGRVEWTASGAASVRDREYKGISPALHVEKATSRVLGIARASLVNTPNLTLASLHRSHQQMEFIALMRQALGLGADASEADVLAAVEKQKADIVRHAEETNAIATAAGLAATAPRSTILTELQSRQQDAGKLAAVKAGLTAAGLDYDKVTATQIELHLKNTGGTAAESQLRSTVIELQTKLETLSLDTARKTAEATIDDAIKAGKVGLKPVRDHYIARHMADPAAVALEIAAMPDLHSGGLRQTPASGAGTPADGLSADELRTCELMGIDPVKFKESRKALGLEHI